MTKLTILFDIDGTLLTTGGAGQQAMADVVAGRRGTDEWRTSITFAGRTDRSILRDIFQLYEVEPSLENIRHFSGQFLPALRDYLPSHPGRVLPAVTATLDCLRSQSQVLMGLLTGNMREAARIKLEHYGLTPYFSQFHAVVGGFGDEQIDRDDVAREALASVRASHPHIEPDNIWVVGDTPNDVKCARAIGAKVLAIATGRYTIEQLIACDPDLAAEDLTQAASWWDLLGSQHGVQRPTEVAA